MNIVGPNLQRPEDCDAVLRTLPMWFGIEHATLMYVRDTTKMPTFALEADHQIIAFLTLKEHFQRSWEIHCMAVSAEARGKGFGSTLLAHAEAWLIAQGGEFLQVKTVAATSTSHEYIETRRFYESRGFTALEIFPELWDPMNPALQYIKRLQPA